MTTILKHMLLNNNKEKITNHNYKNIIKYLIMWKQCICTRYYKMLNINDCQRIMLLNTVIFTFL